MPSLVVRQKVSNLHFKAQKAFSCSCGVTWQAQGSNPPKMFLQFVFKGFLILYPEASVREFCRAEGFQQAWNSACRLARQLLSRMRRWALGFRPLQGILRVVPCCRCCWKSCCCCCAEGPAAFCQQRRSALLLRPV